MMCSILENGIDVEGIGTNETFTKIFKFLRIVGLNWMGRMFV